MKPQGGFGNTGPLTPKIFPGGGDIVFMILISLSHLRRRRAYSRNRGFMDQSLALA